MNLGEAVYRLIAGRTTRVRAEDPREMVERALAEAGGVSQLARALGVARTTVQRWNRGSTPTQESQELLRTVLRRANLTDRREDKLRLSDRLIIKGRQDGRNRRINLSPYLAPGTMNRAVDAYLRGASPADLHVVVWSGITDRHYRWMLQPPGGLGQASSEARRAAMGKAMGGGAGGGSGGSSGHSGGGGGPSSTRGGGDDEDEDGEDDYDGDEYDDYDGGEYLDDLYGEGLDVADNDGYEFSVGSAAA